MKERLCNLLYPRKIILLLVVFVLCIHTFLTNEFNGIFEQITFLVIGYYFGQSDPIDKQHD